MTAIDKQAAIAALGGPEKAREQIRSWLGRDVYLKEHELALRIALAALEGDDGRALLRQLREHVAEWQRLHEQAIGDPTVDQRVLQGYLAIERDVMDKIDRLLAAEPAQIAEPTAPDGDDEARIAKWWGKAGEAPAQGAGDDVLRTASATRYVSGPEMTDRVRDDAIRELCRRELARGER